MNIEELRIRMQEEEYDGEYIDLCVKYAQQLIDNNMPVIFDTRHLAALMGAEVAVIYSYYIKADMSYNDILIPKRTGGVREISAPSENLKYIQRWLLDNVLKINDCLPCVTGFVDNKSIVDNARLHVGKDCVINIDLKDFFPNVKFIQVYRLFRNMGYTRHLAMVFSGLTTYNGVLPQGSPASPCISNLICQNLDRRLMTFADKIEADYTRYADDITFSGRKGIAKFIPVIKHIIKEEQFVVNEKKVRVHYQYHKQMVTGLVVNEKLSVPSKTKKYLRQQIYYSKKFGVDKNLQNQGLDKSNFKGHLYGLAYFIKMVEAEIGQRFISELDEIKWDS